MNEQQRGYRWSFWHRCSGFPAVLKHEDFTVQHFPSAWSPGPTLSMSVASFCCAEFRENKVFMTLFYFTSFSFAKGGSVEALYFSFEKVPQEAKKPLMVLNMFCFLFQSKGA